jgi:hypothetical protein
MLTVRYWSIEFGVRLNRKLIISKFSRTFCFTELIHVPWLDVSMSLMHIYNVLGRTCRVVFSTWLMQLTDPRGKTRGDHVWLTDLTSRDFEFQSRDQNYWQTWAIYIGNSRFRCMSGPLSTAGLAFVRNVRAWICAFTRATDAARSVQTWRRARKKIREPIRSRLRRRFGKRTDATDAPSALLSVILGTMAKLPYV